MREPRPLPSEARRAAWDRLWRILLSPPVPAAPAGERRPGPTGTPDLGCGE